MMAVGFHWGMIRTEALHQALQVANASLDRHLWEMQLVQTVASRSMFGGEHSHQHYHPVFQLISARIYSAISQVFGGTPSLCWKDTWRSSATHSSSKGGLGSDGVFLVGVQGTCLLSGLDVHSDGSIRHTACSSKAVWKMLGLCPSQLELRVRRLRWSTTGFKY